MFIRKNILVLNIKFNFLLNRKLLFMEDCLKLANKVNLGSVSKIDLHYL
jgi:hypothetical protein